MSRERQTDWRNNLIYALGLTAFAGTAMVALSLYLENKKKDDLLARCQQAKLCCDPTSRFRNDFDIVEEIGSGAFGKVYKARKRLIKTYSAVKEILLYPTFSSVDPLKEAEALAILEHENVVRYFNTWCEVGFPKRLYIEMQFCSGGNLKQRLKNNDLQQQYEKSANIWNQIMKGVVYIHQQSIIHRDLKPANIVFENSETDKIRIGDFGIAVGKGEREIFGTKLYMPLKFIQKQGYYHKVDIFASGLILFELLHYIQAEQHEHVLTGLKESKYPKHYINKHPKVVSLLLRT